MDTGDELYDYILKHGPLPVGKVQKIFAQLVGAVSYVHSQSCVHRDLKLENILFDRHENVKLVDFGFTREYEGRTNHLQTFCGTICYAAPEMLKGERYAGEKVDVWSLGIILYALLCGELPFDDDDDNITRTKILSEDPNYPEHLPPDAVALLKMLLSKRPFPRPSLPEILAHSFIAEHAPAQKAILEVKAETPFSTLLEKDCLHRMRAAGIDIDRVIESVLAKKCDALAGWWALLLEKEERKMVRRELKRRERDAESKSMRRISAASSRLERMAPSLQDVDEDGGLTSQFITLGGLSHSRSRGRSERRSAHYYGFNLQDLPQLSEAGRESGHASAEDMPPTPIDKDSIRSVSTSRHRRPLPPPKEGVIRSARSRGSTLHLVTTSDALGGSSLDSELQRNEAAQKTKRKPSQAIIAHWKNWTHWIFETTSKRRKWHEKKRSRSTPDLHENEDGAGAAKDASKDSSPRPQTSKYPGGTNSPRVQTTAHLPKGVVANGHIAKNQASPLKQDPVPLVNQPRSGTRVSSGGQNYSSHHGPGRISTAQSYKRQSLSPSPLTPRSGMRRPSGGLRGRKSTSSSVSSVRSMHRHHHSHSKASSTSSTASATSKTPHRHRGVSPHHSVKVLPATPTSTSFPSNIRLVRATPAPLAFYNEGMSTHQQEQGDAPPGSPNPFASGIMFAKRKRSLFKGPSLNFGGGPAGPSPSRGPGAVHSRSGSGSAALTRRSGEITIQEEDEDHFEDRDIEEVEAFAPIAARPGETITEQIIEDCEVTPTQEDAPQATPVATVIEPHEILNSVEVSPTEVEAHTVNPIPTPVKQ